MKNSQRFNKIGWLCSDIVAPTRLKLREELEGKQIFYIIFQLVYYLINVTSYVNYFEDKCYFSSNHFVKVANIYQMIR